MEGIAINLRDLLGGLSQEKEPEGGPRPLHEAQIMELRAMLARECRPNPFVLGDLVTPRTAGRYVGAGEPFLVVEVLAEPVRVGINEKEDASAAGTYEAYDLRVGGLSQGGLYCVWLQRSQELEYYRDASGRTINLCDAPVAKTDGWLAWTGGNRPVEEHVVVEVEFADGDRDVGAAALWSWSHDGAFGDIVRYRIVP